MGCFIPARLPPNVNEIKSLIIKSDEPKLFVIDNFQIVDYTRRINHESHIHNIKRSFPDYKAVEFNCYRQEKDGKHDHSHVIVELLNILNEKTSEELGFIVDYNQYGFTITIGRLIVISKDYNLKSTKIE